MLQALGMSAAAESCYTKLFRLRHAGVEELTDDGEDPCVIASSLSELEQLGLATQLVGQQWQATPLPDAIRLLRTRRVAELDALVLAADSMHLRLVAANDTGENGVQSLIGRSEIVATMDRICAEAQTELCAFDKPPYVTPRSPTRDWLESNSPEWQAITRGVTIRSVYHPGFDATRLRELGLFIEHGEKARTGDVPMKLILVDREVALIPSPPSYAADQEIRATLIRHPILIEALQSLFDAIWDRSVTIVARADGMRRDPRRGALINLLMTGATDVAIAGQLGVTERSVRRWTAELMDELDVQTRLQLGAALARTDSLFSDSGGLSSQQEPPPLR